MKFFITVFLLCCLVYAQNDPILLSGVVTGYDGSQIEGVVLGLANHPDIVQKVVAIHKEAEEWIVANPTEAIQIAIDWLEMDSSPVTNAFNNIIYDYNLNRTGIEMYLNFLIDEDLLISENIPSDIEVFLDGFINTTIIDSLT